MDQVPSPCPPPPQKKTQFFFSQIKFASGKLEEGNFAESMSNSLFAKSAFVLHRRIYT